MLQEFVLRVVGAAVIVVELKQENEREKEIATNCKEVILFLPWNERKLSEI